MQIELQTSPPTPDAFLDALFDCDEARAGYVVRLPQLDMERFVGRDRFLEEMKTRRYTAVANRGQIFIICNRKDLRLLA
jgi:hypothetical protein